MGWTTKSGGVPHRETNLDSPVVQPAAPKVTPSATQVHVLCEVQTYLLNIICMNFRVQSVNRAVLETHLFPPVK
jgi:hypothetical protein